MTVDELFVLYCKQAADRLAHALATLTGPPKTWRVPGSIWPPPDPRTAPFWPNLPAYFGGTP